MKKALAILLALTMLLAFAACSNSEKEEETTTTETTAGTMDAGAPLNFDHISDDETVTIVFPSTFFNEENPATDELTQDQIDDGFETATLNEDGSVSYTMSGANYKAFMKKQAEKTAQAFELVTQSYPSIQDIKYSADFSAIDILVDAEEFRANPLSNISSMLQISNYIETYYVCVGDRIENYSSMITLIDSATGEVLGTQSVPAEEKAAE